MDAETAAELEKKVREIICSPRILLHGCLFQSLDEDHKKDHFERGKEINPVWFDDKPPAPSMFGDVNPQDWCNRYTDSILDLDFHVPINTRVSKR